MDENIRPRSLVKASKDRLSRRESWVIALLLLMISGWAVWQMSQHNRFEIIHFQNVGHPTAYILDTQTGEVKAVSGLFEFEVKPYDEEGWPADFQ